MKDHPIPTCCCPACGYEMTGAMNIRNEGAPDPGDLSLCIACGEYLRFAEDRTLRRLTDEELLGLPADLLQQLAEAETARRQTFALYRRAGKRVPQGRR